MKFIPFILCSFIILSCGSGWNYGGKAVHDPSKKTILLNCKPALEIHYTGAPETALTYAKFLEEYFITLSEYAKPSKENIVLEITPETDIYTAIFKAGTEYFASVDNKAIVYGILQYEWEKRLQDSFFREDYLSLWLRNQIYNLIRIKDYQNLFDNFKLTPQEMNHVYTYICRFLYQQVLFISVQELMDNDPRYFNLQELDQVFSQAVTLPQMADFIQYVVSKFGKDRLIEFGMKPFDPLKWTDLYGEPLNITEEQYTFEIQKANLYGIFTNTQFTDIFDKILLLYNYTTQDTLIHK